MPEHNSDLVLAEQQRFASHTRSITLQLFTNSVARYDTACLLRLVQTINIHIKMWFGGVLVDLCVFCVAMMSQPGILERAP